jgi:hypothetical protein
MLTVHKGSVHKGSVHKGSVHKGSVRKGMWQVQAALAPCQQHLDKSAPLPYWRGP